MSSQRPDSHQGRFVFLVSCKVAPECHNTRALWHLICCLLTGAKQAWITREKAMFDRQRYEHAVQCLAMYEYEVIPDMEGYLVRHCNDPDDISRARHLDDLVELAELSAWAAQRYKYGALPAAAK
jgi:hypothetical protein